MRTKAITKPRILERAKTRAKEKHGKALFDLVVRYVYDVRLTYGFNRKKFVADYNREWKEYCFKHNKGGKIIDLDPESFIKRAADKKHIESLQRKLGIYFPPATLADKLISRFGKY